MTRSSFALALVLAVLAAPGCATQKCGAMKGQVQAQQTTQSDYVVVCAARVVEIDKIPDHPTDPRGKAVEVELSHSTSGYYGLQELAAMLRAEMVYGENLYFDEAMDLFESEVHGRAEWTQWQVAEGKSVQFLHARNKSRPSGDYWRTTRGTTYLHALDPRGGTTSPVARIPYATVVDSDGKTRYYTLSAPMAAIEVR